MGTANFYNQNASRIYACELADDLAYDDLLWELRAAFAASAGDPRVQPVTGCEAVTDRWEADGLRSYAGRIIVCLAGPERQYCRFHLALSAEIIVRSGYYAGVNLDYRLLAQLDGQEVGEAGEGALGEAVRDLLEAEGVSEAGRDQATWRAESWLQRQEPAFRTAIEAVFDEFSTPLRVVARASNGEAFYERAD